MIGIEAESLFDGGLGGIVIFGLELGGSKTVVSLDEFGIQPNAFFGVLDGAFPFLQARMRCTSVGEKDVIGRLLQDCLGIEFNSGFEVLFDKGFIT